MMRRHLTDRLAFQASLALFFFVTSAACHAQTHAVVCSHGIGEFTAEFPTGVRVQVGPARNGQLATRACEATISWDKQKFVVASDPSQSDVDVFGVDLGLGAPVVAFQLKKSNDDCCAAYQIYSLRKPPKLLRTITGGGTFSAADTDLDGRVEIWTSDAAAVDAFENLSANKQNSAPAVILRFESGHLRDVSAEFQPYFNQEIAKVRAQLNAQDLQDFKNSDGGLRLPGHLQAVKLEILQIVWAYLYSGREQQAWRSLADMWPAPDVERIRAAILDARDRGIRAQVESVSTGDPFGRERRAAIFDAISRQGPATNRTQIVPPKPIVLRRPPPSNASEQNLANSELALDLVIDSAGKVRSAQPSGNAPWVDTALKDATGGWRFIPALKDGQAVASRMTMAVSLKR